MQHSIRQSPLSVVAILFVLSLTFLCNGCESSTTPSIDVNSRLPNWTADASDTEKLADAVDVFGFAIRPPQGHKLARESGPRGAKVIGMTGDRRPDGSSPMVLVMEIPIPPRENIPTAAAALGGLLGGVERARRQWAESAIEIGNVNGIEFARASWTGREKETNTEMMGMMYATVQDGKVIQLHTQDLMKHESDHNVGKASILSFQKK